MLRTLADPLRFRIVELLGTEQLCTCHLVEMTGARQPNISNHLRILREIGLVESEPVGRFTYHRLVSDRLTGLSARLDTLAEQAQSAAAIRRPCG